MVNVLSNPYASYDPSSPAPTEVQGITDEVSTSIPVGITYPCIIVEDASVKAGFVQLLKKLLQGNDVAVFMGGTYLGSLSRESLDPFLRIIEGNVMGYLDKDTPLAREYLLALS